MQLHSPTNSLVLNVPDPQALSAKLPKSKLLQHDKFNFAVPFNVASVRSLWDQGVAAPSPIMQNYAWPGKYKPFDHQRQMATFLTLHRRAFNLSEMGTGKSAGCLWAADALMKAGRVRKVLVLSPLSTLRRVWCNDIFDVLMHRTAAVVHGTRDRRLSELEKDVDFYVMNHEGVTIPPVAEAIHTNPLIDLVVIDEASMFRNATTKKYKALTKMLRPDQRLWLLSGTPCPNLPTDAWAQAKLVSPDRVPKFFGGFRRATMVQVTQFKWTPRPEAYKIAYQAMQPAVRFKKKDCMDLPPVVTVEREAPLSSDQKKAFEQMRKQMVAETRDGDISAVHAADKINKLRQILCGSVKTSDGGYTPLDHKGRANTLIEAIEEASAKVLVICPFKGVLPALKASVETVASCEILNGDVSPRRRDDIVLRFKTEADPHVLLCHPKVMSHGLNFTEADTLIFYAPIYSNDEFQQVVERFNRQGQTRKMTIVRMGAHPVEWKIYDMIDKRNFTQNSILDLYKSVAG